MTRLVPQPWDAAALSAGDCFCPQSLLDTSRLLAAFPWHWWLLHNINEFQVLWLWSRLVTPKPGLVTPRQLGAAVQSCGTPERRMVLDECLARRIFWFSVFLFGLHKLRSLNLALPQLAVELHDLSQRGGQDIFFPICFGGDVIPCTLNEEWGPAACAITQCWHWNTLPSFKTEFKTTHKSPWALCALPEAIAAVPAVGRDQLDRVDAGHLLAGGTGTAG